MRLFHRQNEKKFPSSFNRESLRWLILILAMTFFSMSSSLKNEFIRSWDDEPHVLKNLSIRSFDAEHLKAIFAEKVNTLYIPLTSLSFALEYKAVGFDPFVYHLDNLLLHLSVTAMVFLLGLRLGLSVAASGAGALIFGIHPMHVESVAWVTERKDVLYSFFYLLSVIFYLRYLDKKSPLSYFYSVCFALLSILSKPMALSLPLILWLCDWFRGRKMSRSIFLDKAVYFFIIIPVAWLSYVSHARNPIHHFGEGVLLWLWTFSFYIVKFLIPIHLIPFYDHPRPVSLSSPVFIAVIVFVIVLMMALIRYRRNRWLLFSFLFYFLSIFFLFRFDDLKDLHFVADRFMYLPSLGICLGAGLLLERGFEHCHKQTKRPPARIIFSFACIFLFTSMSVLSYRQCQVWKNSLTFWDYSIQSSPGKAFAYYNRGVNYMKAGDNALAVADFSAALDKDPSYIQALNNRANVYLTERKIDLALADYSKSVELNPRFAQGYNNRGLAYRIKGENESAVIDFTKAIELEPKMAEAYINRAIVYKVLGRPERLLSDIETALKIDPKNAVGYYLRGEHYFVLGEYKRAIKELMSAMMIDPRFFKIYPKMIQSQLALGDITAALGTCEKMIKFYPNKGEGYLLRSQLRSQNKDFIGAEADAFKALSLGVPGAGEYMKSLQKSSQLHMGDL